MAASKIARANVVDPPRSPARTASASAALSTPPTRLALAGGAALVTIIAVATLAAYMPVSPLFPELTLDSSWAFALNAALAKGLVFGRDVVFTFGPYASAYTAQYHPATDVQALWSTGLAGVAFAGSLTCLSRGAGRVSAAVLAIFLVLVTRDTLFFALPVAFVLLSCRASLAAADPYRLELSRPVRLTLLVLVLALSVMTLVKGTFVAAALIALLTGSGVLAVRGHRALGIAFVVLFALAIPALWIGAGQPIAALPGFFAAQAPIVAGYTGAMSIPGVGGHPILFAAGALAVGLIYARFVARAGVAGTAMWVAIAALMFIGFKAGFVRQDWHTLIAAGLLVVTAWMAALGTPRLGAGIGVAIALGVWAIIRHDETGLGPATIPGAVGSAYAATAQTLVRRIASPEKLVGDFAESLGAIRVAQPLPEIEGSVDVYSYGQSMLLARGLDWAPRPVLQSYSAYTPRLEQLDADHLTGGAAPQTELVSVQPIDDRLPALEDGLSWPALLTRYDLAALRSDIAILHRRTTQPEASPVAQRPLSRGTYALGQPIALPAHAGPVWARIDARLTALGELVAFLYKPPYLGITYRFADGSQRQFRYVAAMGAAGFVASPLIESTTDLFALELPGANSYFAGRRPASIAIEASGGAGTLWEKNVAVTFWALTIPPAPIGGALLDRVGPVAHHRPQLPVIDDCGVTLVDRPQATNATTDPAAADRFVRAVAWVALPTAGAPAAGTSDDAAALTLRARATGVIRLVPARRIPRADVASFVDLPGVPETTYAVTADLGALPSGMYTVGLQALRAGQKAVCLSEAQIRVRGRASPPPVTAPATVPGATVPGTAAPAPVTRAAR